MNITYKKYKMNFDNTKEPTDGEQLTRTLYTNWVDDHHRDSLGRDYNNTKEAQVITYCDTCVIMIKDNIILGAFFYRRQNKDFNCLEAVWVRPPRRGEGFYKLMLKESQKAHNCQTANVSGYIYDNQQFCQTLKDSGFENLAMGVASDGSFKPSLCTNKAVSLAGQYQ